MTFHIKSFTLGGVAMYEELVTGLEVNPKPVPYRLWALRPILCFH